MPRRELRIYRIRVVSDVKSALVDAHKRALKAQADMNLAARDRAVAIELARSAGMTWTQIGQMLGVSRARAEQMRLSRRRS